MSNDLPFRMNARGLWVPTNQVGQEVGKSGMNQYVRSYVEYSEVYGTTPGWDDVVEKLQRYSLPVLFSTLGRISSALHNTDPYRLVDRQNELLNRLWESRDVRVASVAQARHEEAKQEGGAIPCPVVLFHELQLANAAKLAILEIDPDNEQRADAPDDLADALLMVNELLAREETLTDLPSAPLSEKDRREWERFFVVNGTFNASNDPLQSLARTWDLYLRDHEPLRGLTEYVNLPNLVEELTDLNPLQLWARLFAVYSHWGSGSDDSGALPGPISVDDHFTDNYDFTPEEEDAFWSWISADVATLREAFRRRGVKRKTLKPYDLLPLEKQPVIRINGEVYCPSTLLMLRRATRGLHHLFLNHLPKPEDADEDEIDSKEYLDYRGQVFSDYCERVLFRIFPKGSGRVIEDETLQRYSDDQVCDGAVQYRDKVVLFEYKSTLLPLSVRTEGDWDRFEDTMNRICRRAATQLDSTVRQIRDGRFAEVGLDPDRIGIFVPVIVSLANFPINPLTYDRLASELKQDGMLDERGVQPIQILQIRDLEWLELATLEHDESLIGILEDRLSREGQRMPSLVDHLFSRDHPALQSSNPYLHGLWSELTESAVALLEERKT